MKLLPAKLKMSHAGSATGAKRSLSVICFICSGLCTQRILRALYDIRPGIPPSVVIVIETCIRDLLSAAVESCILSLAVL